MSDARTFSQKKKSKIFKESEQKCFYCHKKLVFGNKTKGQKGAWNADHLIPYSRNGASNSINGVASCINCNKKKKGLTHVEFIKKYGGIGKIDNFVRCHKINKNGTKCKNPAKKEIRQSLYCKIHS